LKRGGSSTTRAYHDIPSRLGGHRLRQRKIDCRKPSLYIFTTLTLHLLVVYTCTYLFLLYYYLLCALARHDLNKRLTRLATQSASSVYDCRIPKPLARQHYA
jgi:hypothetical protein